MCLNRRLLVRHILHSAASSQLIFLRHRLQNHFLEMERLMLPVVSMKPQSDKRSPL